MMLNRQVEKRIMKLIFWFMASSILLIMLTSSAPDPRKEAQAYQLREQADQDALNQQQNRAHAEELHRIQMQDQALQQQHREATAAQWRAGLKTMIRWGFIFATIALCASFLALGFSFSYGAVRIAQATARLADLRSNLVQLGPRGQFPLIIQHVRGDRYAAHNPNTGSVLMLDASIEADRQLIATAGATQIAGVIAQEASKSTDPAGVAIIQPPIVDVQDGPLTVGKNIWRNNE
jgi:hypothetical protein